MICIMLTGLAPLGFLFYWLPISYTSIEGMKDILILGSEAAKRKGTLGFYLY
jgi:hypothetical protein